MRIWTSMLIRSIVFIVLPTLRKIFKGTFIQELRITQSINSLVMKVITKPGQNGYYANNFRGATMYFPPGDVTILPTILNGTYEKMEFEWLYDRIQTVRTKRRVHLIDIGANIGVYSVPIARYFKNSVKITAIEPDPRNLDLLKKNIEANDVFSLVKVLPVAITETNFSKKDDYKFSQNKYGATNRIISNQASDLENSITVQVMQLSDLLKITANQEFKTIIKIDVEGSEVDVVKSGLSTILATKPDLIIEVSNKKEQSNLQAMVEILSFLANEYENAIIIEGKKTTRISDQSAGNILKNIQLGNVILWSDFESELR